MSLQTATNSKTGERVVLINGQWMPFTQSATNSKTGQKAFLVDGRWVTEDSVSTPTPAPTTPVQPETTSNPLMGLVARGAELAGSAIEAAARVGEGVGDFIAEKAPILDTRFVVDEKGARIERPTPEQIRDENQLQYMFDWAESFKNWGREINYEPSTKLGDLADNPLNAVPFIAERVITSAPDMAAAYAQLPAYIFTRTNEILNERLENDNKTIDDATVGDVAASAAAAVVEGTLERFATGRILQKGAEAATRTGRISKEAALQSGTEAVEEAAAYTGATAGTERGFDPKEAALAALEGAIVGGGLGAAAQGVREVVGGEPTKPSETPPVTPPTPSDTGGTPPTPPVTPIEPQSAEDLLNAPPKVLAEDAPESVRYEASVLNEEQLDAEIEKTERSQESLAELLYDNKRLEEQAALAGMPVDTYRNNVQNAFDNNSTRLDVFYKTLDGTLPPIKPTVTQAQAAAAGVSPDVANALNIQAPPPVTGAPSVPADTTTTPPITPPVGTQPVRGGTPLPPSRPAPARPEVTQPQVEGLDAAQRGAPDVVGGAERVEPALERKTSDELFDEIEGLKKQALSLLVGKNGRRPARNTPRGKQYDALQTRIEELSGQWGRQVEREKRAAATPPAAPATQAAPTVAATTAAPTTPTPPTAAGAGAPPVPPTRPPTGPTPSGAPQQPPGKPTPKSPTGQSSIGVVPNATTPSYLNTVGNFVRSLLPLSQENYQAIRALLDSTRITDAMRGGLYAFYSLPQKVELFANELPSLRDLLNVLNVRASSLKARKEELDRNVRRWNGILTNYKKPMRDKFYRIAHESTRLKGADGRMGIDFKDPAEANNPLTREFNALPDDLKQVYFQMLESYKKMADEYLKLLSKNMPRRLVRKLEREMAKKRVKVYLPLFREGDYWLRYQDQNNDTVVRSFKSNYERQLAIKEAVAAGASQSSMQPFARSEGFTKAAGGPFFHQLMEELNKQGVPTGTKRALFEMYLDLIPAQSVRQLYKQRDGYKGYEADLMNVYATVASRMANQLTNLEFVPDIDKVYADIKKEVDVANAQATNLATNKLWENLQGQQEFLRDPGNSTLVNSLSSFSYYMYIIGNVSTAVINLTQLPMVVYPLLAGKYGVADTTKAMTDAQKQYFKGGWDNDNVPGGEKRFPSDYTFGVGLKPGTPLYKLYEAAVRQSAIRRSTGYDLIEGRKKTYGMGDYVGLKAKTEQILGWVFQNSERMNREVTLIAAFNLEMAKNGGNVDNAIKTAIDTVTQAHGVTLTETSPAAFQKGFGKVAFTFKNFSQTMIYLQTKLIRDALKGETPEVRKLAAKQFLGISTMAFTFAGIQGMPFYGAATVMADLMHDLLGDEDEPWKADNVVRASVKSVAYKGPVNELLMADVAARTGFANLLWRDDDKRLEEVGPILYAMEQIFGPSYAAFMGWGRAYNDYKEGYYDRAVESLMPSFIRNPLKAYRYTSEGALTRDKEVLYDDFNKYELFMQTLGFTPVEVSRRSEQTRGIAEKKKDLEDRKKALLDRLYLARISGDEEGVKEARAAINKYNEAESVKKYGQRITNETIARSFKGRKQRSAQSTFGIYSPRKMQRAIREEFPEPEEPILKRMFGGEEEEPKD